MNGEDEKEQLHLQLEGLGLTNKIAELAVHCLIDMGSVTALVCADEHCLRPGEPFVNGGRRNPLGLSIDHIQIRVAGGSHRPENIRIVHYVCNCSWTKKDPVHKDRFAIATWLRRHRKLQIDNYGVDPRTLEGEDLADYIRTNALALHTELSEMLQEVKGWKPWKSDEVVWESDRDRLITEVVDVWFFLANLMNAMRINSGEFVRTYLSKYDEVQLRNVTKLAALDSKAFTALNRQKYQRTQDTSLVRCSCGAGPFIGPSGRSVHQSRKNCDGTLVIDPDDREHDLKEDARDDHNDRVDDTRKRVCGGCRRSRDDVEIVWGWEHNVNVGKCGACGNVLERGSVLGDQ